MTVMHQRDVTSACLKALNVKITKFTYSQNNMKFQKEKLCKLNKSLYGIKLERTGMNKSRTS